MFWQKWVARSMVALFAAMVGVAQSQPAFEVASVKLSQSNEPPAWNFPLGPGDVYAPNGGYLSAKRLPLFAYILFAYKIMGIVPTPRSCRLLVQRPCRRCPRRARIRHNQRLSKKG